MFYTAQQKQRLDLHTVSFETPFAINKWNIHISDLKIFIVGKVIIILFRKTHNLRFEKETNSLHVLGNLWGAFVSKRFLLIITDVPQKNSQYCPLHHTEEKITQGKKVKIYR